MAKHETAHHDPAPRGTPSVADTATADWSGKVPKTMFRLMERLFHA